MFYWRYEWESLHTPGSELSQTLWKLALSAEVEHTNSLWQTNCTHLYTQYNKSVYVYKTYKVNSCIIHNSAGFICCGCHTCTTHWMVKYHCLIKVQDQGVDGIASLWGLWDSICSMAPALRPVVSWKSLVYLSKESHFSLSVDWPRWSPSRGLKCCIIHLCP